MVDFSRMSWPAIRMALRNRALRLLGRPVNPFADTPSGLCLSPSQRHFPDYDQAPLKLRFQTLQPTDVRAWQAKAREKLAELAGYQRATSIPEVVGDEIFPLPGGLVRRRIYLRIRQGVDIPIHLVASPDSAFPKPVMLCLQGTNSGAHISWGEARFPADLEKAEGSYAFALQAAERGYLAIAIEQSCFGERAEKAIRPRSAAPCVDAMMHALLLGRSLMGERCSDVSAVIDWLHAAAAALQIDTARIHAMGHSAGGSVALFSAALDERIAAVLACGCIGYIRDTIGRRRDDQGQNVIPGILSWMEMGDVIGLVAPRPLVSVAGEQDPIWPADGAAAVFADANSIYHALNAANRIVLVQEAGAHFFRPRISWSIFASLTDPAGVRQK